VTQQPDLLRAYAFARRRLERTSTDAIAFDGGVAFLDREFPLYYDGNLLWVEDAGAASADRWHTEADRILGRRGYRHRKVVVVDPDAQRRLEPGFAQHGYAIDRLLPMVQREEPARPIDRSTVEEVSFAEVRPLIEAVNRRQPWATDEEVIRTLTDHRGKLASTVGARFVAARVEGELVGSCELHVDGDEAEIDAVDTLDEHRNRGLASAFVTAAADAARKSGATWVHLWADAEDWPRRWYERLGFRTVAQVADFLRWPDEDVVGMRVAKSTGGA
jgi:GNAT superfamily N-acetyltransferase